MGGYTLFIAKSKMNVLMDAVAVALNNENWEPEEIELLKQFSDRASLVRHGDGTGMDIHVRYAPGTPVCHYCGGKQKGDCENC